MAYGKVKPRFYNRAYTRLQPMHPDIEWTTQRFSHRAVGGPHRANVTATAGEAFLVGLLDYLRCPVELLDEQGHLCWWGYVHEIKLRLGNIQAGVTLDRMYNRIKVTYTALTVGEDEAEEAQTGFGDNTVSQNEYGRKELILDAGNLILDAVGAEQLRDTKLNDISLPLPLSEFTDASPSRPVIEFSCRGWWETLSWQFYSQAAGRLNYLDTDGGAVQGIGQSATTTAADVTFEDSADGDFIYSISGQFLRFSAGQIVAITGTIASANDGTYSITEVNGNGQRLTVVEDVDDEGTVDSIVVTPQGTKAAQSFTTGASDDWTVLSIAVRAKSKGSPSDSLRIALYSESGVAPSASLANGTILGSEIDSVMRWRNVELTYTVAPSTTYWVHVDRTGSDDADDCYHVELSTNAGAGGVFKYWDGASWTARVGVDMPYDIVGGDATTTMVTEALGEAQFVNAVAVTDISGVTTPLYQIEDQTIKQAVETMLDIGAADNTRLLATIDKGRNARIYKEPVAGTLDYRKRKDGTLATNKGVRVEPQRFAAGVWLVGESLETAVPPNTRLATAARAFVEESEYTADGKVRLITKGQKPVWDL